MKRDIRDLLNEVTFIDKKLPKNHRAIFLDKLKAENNAKKRKRSTFLIYKIAASILVLVSLSYFVSNQFNISDTKENVLLVQQLQTVEQKYLSEIDKEWQNFLVLTTDRKLVKRYEKRLSDLNKNYNETSKSFKDNTNNILVIEELIDNLKTRLQLLKDIQEHINILNSKNDNYETNI